MAVAWQQKCVKHCIRPLEQQQSGPKLYLKSHYVVPNFWKSVRQLDFCCLCLNTILCELWILLCPSEVLSEFIADEDTTCENGNVSLFLGSLTDVTTAHRRLTWSLTSRSTSPRTQHQTSPVRSAIKGSPVSPASNRISCCMRRRRLVTSQPNRKPVVLVLLKA